MYEADWQFVLAAYPSPCQPIRWEFLAGAGGSSGARFWRLETALGPLCLRRWPAEHPDRDQLRWIHRHLAGASARGFAALPVPLATVQGTTIVEHGGHLWELAPWLPGQSDWTANPSPARRAAALAALARFHLAACNDTDDSAQPQASPAVKRRLEQTVAWRDEGLEQLRRAAGRSPWNDDAQSFLVLFEPARRIVEPALRSGLDLPVRLQVCIGDVWHDNVLFTGDSVSGFVDFGAMRNDSIAADVARLAASLAEDDQAAWASGLEAYHAVRPLAPPEAALVPILDQAAVLLSGFNWLRWLILEARTFENTQLVRARLDLHLRRLNHLIANTVSS